MAERQCCCISLLSKLWLKTENCGVFFLNQKKCELSEDIKLQAMKSTIKAHRSRPHFYHHKKNPNLSDIRLFHLGIKKGFT